MKKSTIWTMVIIVILLVLSIIVISSSKQKVPDEVTPEAEESLSEQLSEPLPEAEEKTATYEPVTEEVTVPEPDEVIEDTTIAVPIVSVDAAPGVVDKKFRAFSITAENDTYTPSEVIVNQGDTVHIDFVAVDKTYDITFPDYNMKQTAQAGEKKILEFGARRSGKFLFYCGLCGGLDSDVKGYFTIVPKE